MTPPDTQDDDGDVVVEQQRNQMAAVAGAAEQTAATKLNAEAAAAEAKRRKLREEEEEEAKYKAAKQLQNDADDLAERPTGLLKLGNFLSSLFRGVAIFYSVVGVAAFLTLTAPWGFVLAGACSFFFGLKVYYQTQSAGEDTSQRTATELTGWEHVKNVGGYVFAGFCGFAMEALYVIGIITIAALYLNPISAPAALAVTIAAIVLASISFINDFMFYKNTWDKYHQIPSIVTPEEKAEEERKKAEADHQEEVQADLDKAEAADSGPTPVFSATAAASADSGHDSESGCETPLCDSYAWYAFLIVSTLCGSILAMASSLAAFATFGAAVGGPPGLIVGLVVGGIVALIGAIGNFYLMVTNHREWSQAFREHSTGKESFVMMSASFGSYCTRKALDWLAPMAEPAASSTSVLRTAMQIIQDCGGDAKSGLFAVAVAAALICWITAWTFAKKTINNLFDHRDRVSAEDEADKRAPSPGDSGSDADATPFNAPHIIQEPPSAVPAHEANGSAISRTTSALDLHQHDGALARTYSAVQQTTLPLRDVHAKKLDEAIAAREQRRAHAAMPLAGTAYSASAATTVTTQQPRCNSAPSKMRQTSPLRARKYAP